MLYRLDGQVNVKIRPVQVTRARQLNVRQLGDRGVTKPGGILERDEALLVTDQEPEALGRSVRHLNGQSALSTPCGSILVLPNRFERGIDTALRQPMVLGQLYPRLEPKLRLAGGVLDMDVGPGLFT